MTNVPYSHASSKLPGKVYLVGAGPGDPGLFTLKGKALLEQADVVVYDALVSSPILAMIHPRAELLPAGKRRGYHSLSQRDITQLLIEQAHQYETVVRLKGGDPFVFGRGRSGSGHHGRGCGSRLCRDSRHSPPVEFECDVCNWPRSGW